MRTFLSVIVFLIWLILAWCYSQDFQDCCKEDVIIGQDTDLEDEMDEDLAAIDGSGPRVDPARWNGALNFEWSEETPIPGDQWESYRDSLLASLPDDQLFQITGLYRSEEPGGDDFDNLGLARAKRARALFPSIPDERIKLFSREVSPVEGDRENLYSGVAFRFLVNTEKIKEIEDKTVIYFPYNSTNMLNDQEVEAYLDEVVERIKKTGEKVRLTGHTDNIGDSRSNLRMGQWRADVIANYLNSKGVPMEQIITISRGEASPMSSNNTREGRAKNRRTELQIIQ